MVVRDILFPLRGSCLSTVLFMSFSPNRALFKALGISLVLHLVLLLDLLTLSPVALEVPSAPLRLVIGHGEKKGDAPHASTAAVNMPAASEPAALPLSASDSNWSLPAQAQPQPQPQPPSSHAVPEARREPYSEPGPGAMSAAAFKSGEVGAAGAAGTAVVAREGVSADAMRQYRMSLASAARRFKRYPPLARARGWEGTVEVALMVSSQRAMPEVVLVHSSGHELLDEQAQTMVSQAVRETTLPAELKGRDFRVQLPVQFSLAHDH